MLIQKTIRAAVGATVRVTAATALSAAVLGGLSATAGAVTATPAPDILPATLAPVAAPLAPLAGPQQSAAAGNLALTPPMGWNPWYQYHCTYTQADVLANARALVSSGLARDGYDSVDLDDCWMAPERDANGNLQADPTRFPNGIPWLAERIHRMGLKLGIYESFGLTTCQHLPGSSGHYQQDADTFASWGVDLVKLDYCGPPAGITNAEAQADFQQFGQDLAATGRHIVYSEELGVGAGNLDPANADYLPDISLSSQIANMWRVGPDLTTSFGPSVFGNLSADLPLAGFAGPGHWNDLDMVLAGNSTFGWSASQAETQMSIWAEMASPLISSTDLTAMDATTRQILGNKAVIAVDQDPLGEQGQPVAQQGDVDVVSRPLADGDAAVLLANSSASPEAASTSASAVGLPAAGAYAVQNLWTHTTQESGGEITATVPPQSAMLLLVSPLRAADVMGLAAGKVRERGRTIRPGHAHGRGVAPADVDRYPPLTSLSASTVPAAHPNATLLVPPGQVITIPAALIDDGLAPVTHASVSLAGPAGWGVDGSTVTTRVVPGGRQLAGSWQVTVPDGATVGTYTITATDSYRWNGRPSSDTVRLPVTVNIPGDLGPFFDNTGITDDSAPTVGNFDGTGESYSAQALAAARIVPGGPVTAGGVTFTWPDVPSGTPDNVIASGQTVLVPGSGSTLGFLGTAVNGAFTGTGTVYYTDGTSASYTVSFVNWTNGSPPAPGVVVDRLPYLNTQTGELTKNRYLYAAFVQLDPSKTVQAVTLPAAGSGTTGIHIFAVAAG